MNPLPSILQRNIFTYIEVCRGDKSAIYEQRLGEMVISFEVFIIKVKPARYLKGKYLEAKEKFPSNEDFGRSAWTFRSKEKARQKFNQLENI